MSRNYCQVCGNTMFNRTYYGTEPDGTANADYCSQCYKGGHFHNRTANNAGMVDMPWAAITAGQTIGRGLF